MRLALAPVSTPTMKVAIFIWGIINTLAGKCHIVPLQKYWAYFRFLCLRRPMANHFASTFESRQNLGPGMFRLLPITLVLLLLPAVWLPRRWNPPSTLLPRNCAS